MVNVCFYSPGALGHVASVWPLGGLEMRDKVSHAEFHTYVMALSKNPGQWWAWISFLEWQYLVCVFTNSCWENYGPTPLGEDDWKPCLVTLGLCPTFLPFADFILYPFAVINGNLECTAFLSSVSPCSESVKLSVFLWIPTRATIRSCPKGQIQQALGWWDFAHSHSLSWRKSFSALPTYPATVHSLFKTQKLLPRAHSDKASALLWSPLTLLFNFSRLYKISWLYVLFTKLDVNILKLGPVLYLIIPSISDIWFLFHIRNFKYFYQFMKIKDLHCPWILIY